MTAVALVTLVAIVQVMAFQWRVGKGRNAFNVPGPLTTGPDPWERLYRVHLNTVENLVMFFPLLWLCAAFLHPWAAATLGLAFVVARGWYSSLYVADPSTRVPAVWLTGISLYLLLLGTAAGIAMGAAGYAAFKPSCG